MGYFSLFSWVRDLQFANTGLLILSDEYHIHKFLKCYLNNILKKKKKREREVCIEPWLKNRDTNRIVSLVYRYSTSLNTSPFYTASPHYLRSGGSPILRRWSFTQREASPPSPRTTVVFFHSSYKLPKTLTVTTLLLFGHVTLLCGKLLFIKLSDRPVQLSDCQTDTLPLRAASLSVHTGSVRQ